ncbi:MAG: hypothetical protein RI957_2099 [Verrucomicrobiota bacterium]
MGKYFPRMEHHVYFWLKEENKNEADRASFEQGLRDLLKLPGLTRGLWGRPAAVMPRPVIDLSWDYALSMSFTDVAAQDAYQVDPDHQRFIDSHKDKWAQVKVMDMEPSA